MTLFIIIILGLVQGLCEFLPISSSGHLVLCYNIFNIKDNTILLSVVLHVATLLSVLLYYRKEIFQLIKNPFCKTNKLLAVATIPTVIIVVLLKQFVEQTFSGNFIILGFIITAIILLISQFLTQKETTCYKTDITELNINFKQALIIGIAQGVAVFPGISRSGSTIATGLLQKIDKTDCANFSFLLSIPIILGGLLFEILNIVTNDITINLNIESLIVGFLVSFICGLLCIKLMLKLIKKSKLYWFSFYLILLSIFLTLNKFVLFLF